MVCAKAIYYQIATPAQHFQCHEKDAFNVAKRTHEGSRTPASIASVAATGALHGRPSGALKHTRLGLGDGEGLLLNVLQCVARGVEFVPAHPAVGYLGR